MSNRLPNVPLVQAVPGSVKQTTMHVWVSSHIRGRRDEKSYNANRFSHAGSPDYPFILSMPVNSERASTASHGSVVYRAESWLQYRGRMQCSSAMIANATWGLLCIREVTCTNCKGAILYNVYSFVSCCSTPFVEMYLCMGYGLAM